MKDSKGTWRSIKFSENLIKEISIAAKRERRSFSAQALLYIEHGIEYRNSIESGNSQLDINAIREA